MTEEKRLEEEEKSNTDDQDVEAHRRRIADEPKDDTNRADDGDDFEAHRRR
jgi:hypothetical protein